MNIKSKNEVIPENNYWYVCQSEKGHLLKLHPERATGQEILSNNFNNLIIFDNKEEAENYISIIQKDLTKNGISPFMK